MPHCTHTQGVRPAEAHRQAGERAAREIGGETKRGEKFLYSGSRERERERGKKDEKLKRGGDALPVRMIGYNTRHSSKNMRGADEAMCYQRRWASDWQCLRAKFVGGQRKLKWGKTTAAAAAAEGLMAVISAGIV